MLAARTLLGTRISCAVGAGGLDADLPGSLMATGVVEGLAGVVDGLTGAADGLTGAADGLTGAVVGFATLLDLSGLAGVVCASGLATGCVSGFVLLEALCAEVKLPRASRTSAGGGGGGGGGCDDWVTCTGSSGLRTSLLERSNPCARMSSTSWVMDIPM